MENTTKFIIGTVISAMAAKIFEKDVKIALFLMVPIILLR
ncbi:hypothetical protein WKT22_04391 [Candidatus Lokiarchaeum ossiferum]